eukprot:1685215-Rhodomonas_salina.1
MGARHRAWIPILFLSISFLSLAQLALLGASTPWPVALASLVACGFGLFGSAPAPAHLPGSDSISACCKARTRSHTIRAGPRRDVLSPHLRGLHASSGRVRGF